MLHLPRIAVDRAPTIACQDTSWGFAWIIACSPHSAKPESNHTDLRVHTRPPGNTAWIWALVPAPYHGPGHTGLSILMFCLMVSFLLCLDASGTPSHIWPSGPSGPKTLLLRLTPPTCPSSGSGIPIPGLSWLAGVSAQRSLIMTWGLRNHTSLCPSRLTKQSYGRLHWFKSTGKTWAGSHCTEVKSK